MSYAILTPETITDYLQKTPSLVRFLGEDDWEITEIGDGNLNYVYRVQSRQANLILKQAVPYLRCVGENWKLSRDRMLFEVAALKQFHALVPQYVPEVYHDDPAMSLVAMEYLEDYCIARKGLIAGIRYEKFAMHMANFLAETLFKTSSFYLSSSEKRQLEQNFSQNHDLCTLTEEFVFTFPYITHSSNPDNPSLELFAEQVKSNIAFKMNMLDLKYLFMNQRDALLHGDLHTGSIMLTEHHTKIIDPEFSFFGPFGFDIGALVANLILSYISHHILDQTTMYTNWLLDTLAQFLEQFEQQFLTLWEMHDRDSALIVANYFNHTDALPTYRKRTMQQIFQQSIGFAGAKMTRRILGIAGVADIREIADPEKRLQAEKLALQIGVSLVEHYRHISNTTELLTHVKAHCHE